MQALGFGELVQNYESNFPLREVQSGTGCLCFRLYTLGKVDLSKSSEF